jgi:uncharacterized protein
VALLDHDDHAHREVNRFLAGFKGQMFTTWAVLTETCHLLPRRFVVPFMRWVAAGSMQLPDIPPRGLETMATAMEKYSDLPMDLADASLVLLAGTTGITDVLTLDETDFGIYRLPDGKRLRSVLTS